MNDFQCSVIPVRQPSATFYVGSVKATELETICHPLTRRAEGGLLGRETSEPVKLSESQLSALVRALNQAAEKWDTHAACDNCRVCERCSIAAATSGV
jgi:hypothetical protein